MVCALIEVPKSLLMFSHVAAFNYCCSAIRALSSVIHLATQSMMMHHGQLPSSQAGEEAVRGSVADRKLHKAKHCKEQSQAFCKSEHLLSQPPPAKKNGFTISSG